MPARSASARISPARMKLSCSTYSSGRVGRLPGSPQRLDRTERGRPASRRHHKPVHGVHGSSLQMFERGGRMRARSGPRDRAGRPGAPARRDHGDGRRRRRRAVVGAACAVTLDAALARGLLRNPSQRLGPAGWVTLGRATLAVGVAALTADSFFRDVPVAMLVALATVALVLDYVDGWVARRTASASALGARLDGEVDAFLILVLSVYVAPSAGRVGARDRRGALRVPRRRMAAPRGCARRCRGATGARSSRRRRASRSRSPQRVSCRRP